MQLYYAKTIDGKIIQLEEDERHHCINVMRHVIGDVIHVVDGNGNFFETCIESINKNKIILSIQQHIENWGEFDRKVGVIVSMLKSREAMEWIIEKAMELGVTHVYFAQAQHSEKHQFNESRLQKIWIAALKQCMRSRLPLVESPKSLDKIFDSLNTNPEFQFEHKYIAYCPETENKLQSFTINQGASVLIAIGPEGDFSPQEIALAQQNDFTTVNLGQTRLRAETACLYALSILKSKLGY